MRQNIYNINIAHTAHKKLLIKYEIKKDDELKKHDERS